MIDKCFEFPSMTISISFLMDVVCRCISSATIPQLMEYTGKSSAYVKGALTSALLTGMIVSDDEKRYVTDPKCASSLTQMPTEELKVEVFRTWLQQLEPFILFVRYIGAGDSSSAAAMKVSSFFSFNRPIESIEKVLVSWGKGVGILDNQCNVIVSQFNPVDAGWSDQLREENTINASIRIYLSEALTPEVYAWLEHSEIEELVSCFRKCQFDPRAAIECAGRACEDVLRRIALAENLDVKKQNGISQVANYLYSHRDMQGNSLSSIHSKQYNISQAIGDIRNMAGHSKEAKTMERWELSSVAATAMAQTTIALIKSIYYYTTQGVFSF